MKTTHKSFLIICICLLQCIATFGQISTKEAPVSFGVQNLSAKSLLPTANKVTPALNMTLINQEDESDEANGLPLVERSVSLCSAKSKAPALYPCLQSKNFMYFCGKITCMITDNFHTARIAL
jgi:hypothetical protein